MSDARLSPPNPFLALRWFEKSDARRFFGRESDLVLVQSRIYSSRAMLLFAASGVGKTSFLNARLLTEFEERWLIVLERSWAGVGPLAALRRAVARTTGTDDGPLDLVEPIARALKQAPAKQACLIVLDQFEEVFHRWRDTQELDDFAGEIARLANTATVDVRILISMREEFLGELSIFDNLIPDLFNHSYRLKNPTRFEAEDIIRQTVSSVDGIKCGRGLRVLLDDLQDASHSARPPSSQPSLQRRVPMPFLQIVCHRNWEREFQANGSSLHSRQFLENEPTPARDELRSYCAEKLDRLTPAQRRVAAAAIGFLVTPGGAKMAYPADVLATQANASAATLAEVLEALAADDARILQEISVGGENWFELYHDVYASFLTEWKHAQDQAARRGWVWRSLAAAFVAIASVVYLGFLTWQSRGKEEAAQVRVENEIADRLQVSAQTLQDEDLHSTVASLLLAIEAFARAPSLTRRETLQHALEQKLIERTRLNGVGDGLIALHPEGRLLAAAVPEQLMLLDLDSATVRSAVPSAAEVLTLGFSPAGDSLASGRWDGALQILDTATGQVRTTKTLAKGGAVTSIAYGAGGTLMAAATRDAQGIFRAQIVQALPPWDVRLRSPGDIAISAVAFSPDGQLLATGGAYGELLVVDLKGNVVLRRPRVPTGSTITSMAFGTSGRRLALGRSDGGVQIASLDAEGEAAGVPSYRSVTKVAWSVTGRYFAAASEDGVVRVWRSPDQMRLGTTLSIPVAGRPSELAFSPDDQLLVVGGDRGAEVFETASGSRIASLSSGRLVTYAAFSGDGSRLVLKVNRDVRVLGRAPKVVKGEPENLSVDDLREAACALAGRTLTATERTQYLGQAVPIGCP